jgi:hypothetical protein
MHEEFKKKLNSLLKQMDNKVLQTKLNKILEKIKNGEHDDLIQKINSTDQNELLEKLQNLDQLSPQEIELFRQNLNGQIQKEDLSFIKDQLDPEKRKIIEKIISTLKIN